MTIKTFALKITLGAALALGVAACGNQTSTPEAAHVPTAAVEDLKSLTKVKAVLIYAKWCGSCKILDPKLKALRAETSFPGAEFVTLDYTAKDEAVFYAAARKAGVEDAVRAHMVGKVKTGQLLLVSQRKDRVVGVVTKSQSNKEIETLIMTTLAGA